jgi:hypothetical protein
MPTDVELPAFRASLRIGLPRVVGAVEDFVPDDGAARQAFTELRPVDEESLIQRVCHKPQATPDRDDQSAGRHRVLHAVVCSLRSATGGVIGSLPSEP